MGPRYDCKGSQYNQRSSKRVSSPETRKRYAHGTGPIILEGTRLAEECIVRVEREVLHVSKLVLHAVGGIWSGELSEILLVDLEHADLCEVLSRIRARREKGKEKLKGVSAPTST